MLQLQTEKIHFDPDYNFDWDDYASLNNLKDWPSFRIEYADGRMLIFNLEKGITFEQHDVGGLFYPVFVLQHEYKPATIKSEDECYFKNQYGEDDFDATLLWERGQRGSLTFTRLHWVNGVPKPAKDKQIMSTVRLRLEGTSFTLTEDTWINGTPWHLGTPVEVLDSNRTGFPKNLDNYFTEEIEVIQISSDFQVTEDLLIHKWKHSKVGTIEIFQHETFDGQKRMRAVLTDQKGRKVRFTSAFGDPAVLISKRGQFNWQTGELITSYRRLLRTKTRKMNYMAV
jgi:hypothetical protein